uniref:Uncharacterized protein n=1 Tax=Magallana gigas TaxID=29159 RepID=A0A8W8LWQ6_MAGGI
MALKTYLVVGLTLLHLSSAEKDPAAFVKSLTSNCREIGWEPTCERKARNSITVAFHVKLKSTITGISQNQIIKYDDVITNIGEGYDPTTGYQLVVNYSETQDLSQFDIDKLEALKYNPTRSW